MIWYLFYKTTTANLNFSPGLSNPARLLTNQIACFNVVIPAPARESDFYWLLGISFDQSAMRTESQLGQSFQGGARTPVVII